MKTIKIYDTTLRDGSQSEDISFSVEDKLQITKKLDELGVHYIEGGWPFSNLKDEEYFKKIKTINLKTSQIVAFGSTHHPKCKPKDDINLKTLIECGVNVVTIFGKTWDFHLKDALNIPLKKGIEIIFNSITFLKSHIPKVFFDAEHFFDGYKSNSEFALKCLIAAQKAGADCLILCDTNGGTLPLEIEKIILELKGKINVPIGIHCHNDSECAVANSILAVELGVSQIQGTINGFGERCGNANLCSIIPNLELKLGYQCLPKGHLKRLKETSRFINEIANLTHFKNQPFVGESAFAHKAGVHVSAVMKSSKTYEHISPEIVGNDRRILISDLSGKSNVIRKIKDFGIELSKKSSEINRILAKVKELEHQGFQFESADASFELLVRRALKQFKPCFNLIRFTVITDNVKGIEDTLTQAVVHLEIKGKKIHTAAIGNGPVNALDKALRKALEEEYPKIKEINLLDYKVRVLSTTEGTEAKVRVLVISGDGKTSWTTVGVSENIIEASWQSLVDSIEYKLLKKDK